MMDGLHPSDIELLEYAEGELPEEAAVSVREHLASCETCAREVAAVERSRAVLRASPLLELPEQRLRAMIEGLPRQEVPASEQRRFLRSRTRLLAVLTPAALATVAVVAVVLVTRDGSETSQSQAEAVAAETAAADAAEAPTAPAAIEAAPAPAETQAATTIEEAPAEDAGANETFSEQARTPAFEVQGPPREVVRVLTEEGIDARVVEGSVEVRGATPEEVERALGDRPSGPVAVYLER